MDQGARKNVGRWNPINSQLAHLYVNVTTLFTAKGPLSSSQNKVLARRQVTQLNSNPISHVSPLYIHEWRG